MLLFSENIVLQAVVVLSQYTHVTLETADRETDDRQTTYYDNSNCIATLG